MSPHDLVAKLRDEPFKPFRVRLSDGAPIDVLNARSVVVGPTNAVMPLEYVDQGGLKLVRRWKTVALQQMIEFIDIDAEGNGPRRRRE